MTQSSDPHALGWAVFRKRNQGVSWTKLALRFGITKAAAHKAYKEMQKAQYKLGNAKVRLSSN